MKKLVLLLPLAILAICVGAILFTESEPASQDDNPTVKKKTVKPVPEAEYIKFETPIDNYFAAAIADRDAVNFKRLTVYPIMASEEYIKDHDGVGKYLNLKEALAERAVRIVEKEELNATSSNHSPLNLFPSGGIMSNDLPIEEQQAGYAYSEGASVNTLVIENNSEEDVYLMAGDVVQGGRQDRVIAEDMIIAAKSGAHEVPVFCVESNRWSYKAKPSSTTKEPIYAFTGYFNVASNSIRQTVKHDKNQSEVWSEVSHITTKHGANSSTNTYSALQKSSGFTKQRDEYLNFFANQFTDKNNVVGIMVVSGDKVLGTDIFATPDLFRKQYDLLLHSYITDALTFGDKITIGEEDIKAYFQKDVVDKYFKNQSKEEDKALKFVKDEKVIHFSAL